MQPIWPLCIGTDTFKSTHTFNSQHLPISWCLFVCLLARVVFSFCACLLMQLQWQCKNLQITSTSTWLYSRPCSGSLSLSHSRRRCKHLTFFNCILGYMTHDAQVCVCAKRNRFFLQTSTCFHSCKQLQPKKMAILNNKTLFIYVCIEHNPWNLFDFSIRNRLNFPRGKIVWHFHHSALAELALYRIHFGIVSTLNYYHSLKTSHSNMPHTLPQIFTWKSCTAKVSTVRN